MAASLEDKAKQYSTIKYSLALGDVVLLLGVLFVSLSTGVSKVLESALRGWLGYSFLALPLYVFIGVLGYYCISFPLNFYRSYLLEHRFSLTQQKIQDWLLDQGKTFILSYVIIVICAQTYYYVLTHFPLSWWLVISLVWIFFSLVLAKLLPVAIIPLFFKYKKLDDEGLRERIKSLAAKMKVELLDVFQLDLSRKTLKANAAFVGWGATRRVILADTLQNHFTLDEIEVVIAHEFAHCRLKHLFKLILVSASTTIISFFLIFKTHRVMLSFFGLSSLSEFAALPVVLIYFLAIDIFVTPLHNALSRIFEKNADIMAIQVSEKKDAFISAMEKLALQNLADRKPHPVIKFLFFDHPAIEERISLAKSLE